MCAFVRLGTSQLRDVQYFLLMATVRKEKNFDKHCCGQPQTTERGEGAGHLCGALSSPCVGQQRAEVGLLVIFCHFPGSS